MVADTEFIAHSTKSEPNSPVGLGGVTRPRTRIGFSTQILKWDTRRYIGSGAPQCSGAVQDILGQFVAIVTKSSPATVGLVLSSGFGYGISFVLLDYRRAAVKKAHFLLHVVLGLGYAATMFTIVNYDLLSYELTIDHITSRMPITLVLSFVVSFILIIGGMLWRERAAPYATIVAREEE